MYMKMLFIVENYNKVFLINYFLCLWYIYSVRYTTIYVLDKLRINNQLNPC